jgi:hypothetical protein
MCIQGYKSLKTLSSTKIAFTTIFNKFAFTEGVMAAWSFFIHEDLKSPIPPSMFIRFQELINRR